VATTDACAESERLEPQDRAGGVREVVFPNLSNWWAWRYQLYTPCGLGGWLMRNAETFDLAHLHACRNLPEAIAASVLRGAGVPYVLQPNGTAPRIERRRLAKILVDLVWGRRVVRGAARFIAVSNSERRQLLELWGDGTAIDTIANPIDLGEYRDLEAARFRARHGLEKDRSLVLYLGQLGPRKRVDLLLRAVAGLRGPRPMLAIAGADMGSEGRLRRIVAELGLASSTVFTGVLEGRERLDALAAADVVVYPSQHEVFGLVAVEALLCGTPVVVADDSGCGEVIEATGGGLVVASGDVGACREAVTRILDSPGAWLEPVAQAAEVVRQRYPVEVVARDLMDCYRRARRDPREPVV
jgi:glycosyltransferase involved in cell wall biosynthesis